MWMACQPSHARVQQNPVAQKLEGWPVPETPGTTNFIRRLEYMTYITRHVSTQKRDPGRLSAEGIDDDSGSPAGGSGAAQLLLQPPVFVQHRIPVTRGLQ